MCKCGVVTDVSWGANKECTCIPKPHKHAAVIKAWADGAVIEWRPLGDDEAWTLCLMPEWILHCDYRVKPEKKSPGQLSYESWNNPTGAGAYTWDKCGDSVREMWESNTQKFLAAMKEQE